MKAVIGIDIGTQGVKAAVFTIDGRCLGQAFAPSQLLCSAAGEVEEDPEVQVANVCRTMRMCMHKAGLHADDVAGIGLDGQMAGVIGVDREGRCVTPYDSWLDTRCAPYIAVMNRRAGTRIVQRTGGPASFNHGPKALWWKQERPNVYRRIHAFVQPAGYAAMRLCDLHGDAAFIDWTYLHFSGFADTAAGKWDAGLCRTFDMDGEKLPRIVAPQTVIGELSARMARRCGVRAGVPVVAGCGDTAASFLACGAVAPGICVDVAGTASVFAATGAVMQPDVKNGMLSCGRSAVPGLWHSYAYINGGGMNLEWFRRELAGSGKGKLPSWDELEAQAAQADVNGPFFVPHMAGRVSPPQPNLRGAWVGLSHVHTRGDLFRALLESVALEYAVYRDVLRTLHRSFQLRELRITGGGERNALWNQMKADALGVPVRRILDPYGAPMGAAMLAGWGVGLLPGLTQAAQTWVKPDTLAIRPNAARAESYRQRTKVYQTLLKALDLPLVGRKETAT